MNDLIKVNEAMPDGIPTAQRFALKYRKDKGQQNE
jgi:hypothetical protein